LVGAVANTQRIEKLSLRDLGKEWDNRDRLFPLSEGKLEAENPVRIDELRANIQVVDNAALTWIEGLLSNNQPVSIGTTRASYVLGISVRYACANSLIARMGREAFQW
jgi:hypothetical protein